MAGLREHDLRALVGLREDGQRDDPGPAMPWAVLEGLRRLVPCDVVSFNELDVRHRQALATQDVFDDGRRVEGADDEDPLVEAFWAEYWDCLLCSYPERSGDYTSVVRFSDFYSRRQLLAVPMYAEYFRPLGIEHELMVSLPSAPGRTRRVLFSRSGRDFDERDRLTLAVLRPHLYEIYLDAERRRRGIPHLTPREWEVLQLAAAGYGNAEIARALYVSVATVRKHLEHVFDRLGVRTRAAAAALALPHAPAAHTLRGLGNETELAVRLHSRTSSALPAANGQYKNRTGVLQKSNY